MLERRESTLSELARFFLVTLVGLSIDIGLFALLTVAGINAGISNAVSSTCAVIVLYFLNTRFTFPASSTRLTVLLFFAWYAVSIAGFSALVHLLAGTLPEMWAKVVTLPLSFIVNFIAVKIIVARTAVALDPSRDDS